MTTSSLLDRSFRTAALVLAAGLVARGAVAQDGGGGAAPPAGEARAETPAGGPTQAQADAAVKALKEGLASKEAATRVAALRAAADVPHADVAKAVAVALKDKDENVEIAAMEALGKLRTPEGLKELIRAASDKQLRKNARLFSTLLKAIGRHGDPSAIAVLSDSPWDNTDTAVIRARIYGLGNIRDVRAIDALMEMMNKGSPLPGEDAPFMPDFRVALARLTGTDQTTNKSLWQTWWKNNKKGFQVSDEQLAMPADLQAKWDEYWGTPAAPAPAAGK